MTEPVTATGQQNAGTSGAASILLNYFEAHNVGHVIEALHYCLGHHRANPDMRLSVLLNALAPTELAQLCPFVETVYPVKLPGYPEDTSGLSEADCLAALRDVPCEWDYVLDNPRRTVRPQLEAVPGFALYYEASDLHLRARKARVLIGGKPPGYVPRGHLRLNLPPSFSQFGELPILEDDTDGEGPRTPTMSRERILQDLDELLQATEWLVEERLEYRESLQGHYERFLRFNGGDTSTIFSIDDVHSEFV